MGSCLDGTQDSEFHQEKMAALFLGKTYMELAETEKAKENLEKAIQLAKEQNHDDPAEEATQLLKECNLKE